MESTTFKFSENTDSAICGLVEVCEKILQNITDHSLYIDLDYAIKDVEHHMEKIPMCGIDGVMEEADKLEIQLEELKASQVKQAA